MPRTPPLLLVLFLTFAFVPSAVADVVYLYDDLGRLVRVIRENGEAASYHYDPVGNLLQIARESGVPQATTVASVSTSRLTQGRSTILTITGVNLAGATITASTAPTSEWRASSTPTGRACTRTTGASSPISSSRR